MDLEILFCSDPDDPAQVDPAYSREAELARCADLSLSLLDHEALVDEQDPRRAARRIPRTSAPRLGVYRGWMLSVESYAALSAVLAERGLTLINSLDQYRHCHHLPASYELIRAHTPRTVWLAADAAPAQIMAALAVFQGAPVILKDYVKSQKHFWTEACFIPSSSDADQVQRVVDRFRELQGELQGGLVFRQYVELETIGAHPESGMPLGLEYRLVVLDGAAVAVFPYWDEASTPPDAAPPLPRFEGVLRSIQSRFFTADLARTRSGEWILVELGDGQVAGYPDRADPSPVYRAIAALAGRGRRE